MPELKDSDQSPGLPRDFAIWETHEGDDMISASLVLPMIHLARRRGIDTDRVLSDAGLTMGMLLSAGVRIPQRIKHLILQELLTLTNSPTFGLQASKYSDMHAYGLNGLICMNSNSLKEALLTTLPLFKVLSDRQVMHMQESNGEYRVFWDLDSRYCDIVRNNVELHVGTWIRFCAQVLRLQEKPRYVCFKHGDDYGQQKLYEEYLGTEVLFKQTHNAIIYDSVAINEAIFGADSRILEMLHLHANAIVRENRSESAFSLQVKEVLRSVLRKEKPNREIVASHFGVASRTLQRRLVEEGTSFSDLLDAVRQERAEFYLQRGNIKTEDVANRLGFSDSRSFQRSFKRWTGKTIGVYKKMAEHYGKTDIRGEKE